MTLTLSVVLILGVTVAALLKFRAVGLGAAVLVALFGFYLGGTDAAGPINQFVNAFAEVVGGIGN
ncbi:hypothetical protein [Streptomyces nanshensis]|uniref:Uncharacterized protein n=1 Tax=Streptomyces nanshensis TaxID=518642 RepID=A0A1E7L2T6_9ACTN|nr:hypothetical protein [Streptomyces nanshensis]OEV10506.1 hypothetical protein AN218_17285 [Streptomyces nanshensis]